MLVIPQEEATHELQPLLREPTLSQGLVCTPSVFSLDLDYTMLQGFRRISLNSGTALLNGERVLVEWKTLPTHPTRKNLIIEQARSFAVFLSEPRHRTFRCLRCVGLAQDVGANQVAFIFALPQ